MERKQFLKKACISGACLCGFGGIAIQAESSSFAQKEVFTPNDNQLLIQDWISTLILNIKDSVDEGKKRTLLKNCAKVHYNYLKMDELLADYIGNIEKFKCFLTEKWGWKIDCNQATNSIIADENKNLCVCPIIPMQKGVDTSAMCYCSEGFAEWMFSKVLQVPVKASVIASIRRGDSSCKYKIEYKTSNI